MSKILIVDDEPHLRLLYETELRRAGYEDDDLRRWRDTLAGRGFADAFVFMKHEDSCAGPALARRFLALGGAAPAS